MSILLTTKEDFIRNKKEILKRIGDSWNTEGNVGNG